MAQLLEESKYLKAWEDPAVDGQFTTADEYKGANIVRDDLDVGWFYKESMQNWIVKDREYADTISLFSNHYFEDSRYGTLDLYDLNTFEVNWGSADGSISNKVTTWVFESGDHPADIDWRWLDAVGIGTANYPTGINDDGGFLVRLNDDPTTDQRWLPGDPVPGDAAWDFSDYYGVFAQAGFNDSAYTEGYSTTPGDREIYEWSITLSTAVGGGGIPGIPSGPGNPAAPGVGNPDWFIFGKGGAKVSDPTGPLPGPGPAGPGWWASFNQSLFMPSGESTYPYIDGDPSEGTTPEPSSLLALGGGLLGLVGMIRRRK